MSRLAIKMSEKCRNFDRESEQDHGLNNFYKNLFVFKMTMEK